MSPEIWSISQPTPTLTPLSLFASLKGKQTALFPSSPGIFTLQKLRSTLGSSLTCIRLYETSPGLSAMWKNVSMVGEKNHNTVLKKE